MIKKVLKNLGLSSNEVEVYLVMISISQATASSIASETEINRTTVYDTLKLLMNRGLVSKIKKSSGSYFYALPPDKLINYLEREKQKAEQRFEQQQQKIEKILPDLISLQNLKSQTRPKVQFFEETAGIKEAYNDILKYKKQTVLSWFPRQVSVGVDNTWMINFFVKERIKRNIWIKAIAPSTETMLKKYPNDPKSLRIVKFMDANKLGVDIDLSLYGNKKVLITGFDEKIAIIIESKQIYTSLKSIFEIMWEGLE